MVAGRVIGWPAAKEVISSEVAGRVAKMFNGLRSRTSVVTVLSNFSLANWAEKKVILFCRLSCFLDSCFKKSSRIKTFLFLLQVHHAKGVL